MKRAAGAEHLVRECGFRLFLAGLACAAAHAVVQEAMDAGVWVFGGGLAEDVDTVMVAGDGTITAGTYPQTREFSGGFTVLDVPSREAALQWAAKIAAACRCAQEIREFMPDPAVGN